MKSLFKIVAVLIPLMWMASCGPSAKFNVIGVDDPVFNGLTSVHGRAVVASSARRDLVIESAELRMRYKQRELATARLMLPLTVPADAITHVRYDFKLESESLSNLQTLQNRIETNPSQVFADITAWVRYGNIRRKIRMENVPYNDIIANFGQL